MPCGLAAASTLTKLSKMKAEDYVNERIVRKLKRACCYLNDFS